MIKKFNHFLLLEKEIILGDTLENKLKKANNDLAKDILSFLKSDKIRDDINVDSVDIKDDDNKTLTVKLGNKYRKYKIGKLLQILGYDITKINTRELEDIVSHLKKTECDDIRLVRGEDIKDVYLEDNYELGNGDLNHSCMKYENCQDLFDIYTKNPEVCSCVVLYNEDGKVRGRALLLETNVGLYMDRIYLSNNEYKPAFLKYCEENDIKYTYYNNSNQLNVNLEEYDFYFYPYMDTFFYLDCDVLYNDDKNIPSATVYCLNSTSGHYEEFYKCALTGEFLSFGNVCYIESGKYAYDYISSDYVVLTIDGEYVLEGDVEKITVGSYVGKYILKDSVDVVTLNYLKYDNDIAHIDDCVVATIGEHSGELFLVKDTKNLNYGEYEDEVAYDGDCIEVTYGEYKGEYILVEDSVETENGIEYKKGEN